VLKRLGGLLLAAACLSACGKPGPYGYVGDAMGIPQLEQRVYDGQVALYGQRAVYSCRAQMSPSSPRYRYCLALESGAVR
jgi:hypothetical protein